MENMICQGCGAVIQTSDPDRPGYTPESALDNEPLLCQRCFRLKHYNDIQDVSMTDDDFLSMVGQIRNKKGLVVHLVDIFDVDGTLIKSLPRIVGDKPVVLAANKMDLLPKSTNRNKLTKWLRTAAKEAGLTVEAVYLISSAKGHGMSNLTEAIEHYRRGKDVYIVGTTNVGKSTFINKLIQRTTGAKDVITTSYFPGTTLGFIEIPLDGNSVLIDTPGIVNRKQMAHYVSDSDLKVITPKKEVKPRVYQLNSEQTLYFGGLARIDFIKGERQSFVCYFSNELAIHRTKLENADKLLNEHRGGLLSPPGPETLQKVPELTKHAFRLDKEKTDIVFPGLGWVTLPEGDITVAAHSPKGVQVSLRKSFT
ncbi:ribosome biogenesis GTPase YqeH [Lentibacillus amyloliquefaciens]|uniref:Ribosome biogenesis GTPase YqeH n=1 Tax=Lentibacillus amyloliquefaciens TaxID=1472767 RepID=A0A0U4F5R9_9BACI|nr:ribosome biogenesis GTPase YqeH [Lentibacillus amyloliquefaciens]ALX48147.1 ribosome biogenesis GTPase YqeH [Lentibacillus amyloliquefaciens]